MTYLEPERLAIKLQELLERHAALRRVLEAELGKALAEQERAAIFSTLDAIGREVALLEKRLDALRFGSGGTG